MTTKLRIAALQLKIEELQKKIKPLKETLQTLVCLQYDAQSELEELQESLKPTPKDLPSAMKSFGVPQNSFAYKRRRCK